MNGEAFTTAATLQSTRAWAVARSRSRWSTTAISPGRSRRTSEPVRRSRRTGPITPGRASSEDWRRGSLMAIHRDTQPDRIRAPRAGACVTTGGATRVGSGPAGAGALRRGEQLLGVRERGVGVLETGEHPGQLADPSAVVEGGQPGRGHGAVVALDDDDVAVGEGG